MIYIKTTIIVALIIAAFLAFGVLIALFWPMIIIGILFFAVLVVLKSNK